MNLKFKTGNWFILYKGLIYKSQETDVNSAINNKQSIDKEQRVKPI